MRRKYIEKYNFFTFLGDLSNLPDKCCSLPYYFKESSKLDAFLIFTRFEDVDDNLPYFRVDFNCQSASTRSQKNLSYTLFTYDLNYKLFRDVLFLINFRNIKEFLSYLSSYSSEFKERLDGFTSYYENYVINKDITML